VDQVLAVVLVVEVAGVEVEVEVEPFRVVAEQVDETNSYIKWTI
jgi:hypothetical protein